MARQALSRQLGYHTQERWNGQPERRGVPSSADLFCVSVRFVLSTHSTLFSLIFQLQVHRPRFRGTIDLQQSGTKTKIAS